MIVKVPTPDEILQYSKQNKIAWSKLQNEEFWWSSNTRYWAFTLDSNVMTYFRLSTNRDRYYVEKKINTQIDAKKLLEFLQVSLN